MLPLFGAIPGGPEILIVLLMMVILPIALVYIAYKLFQGFGEFQRGRKEGR